MQEKIVVLIGITGNGQTSLFNKICNAQETVKAGGRSVTLQSVSKNSAYGKGFKLFDTPGLLSINQNQIKACTIRKVLTQNPINRILIVTKYDRLDSICQQLNKIITQCLQRYRLQMTVVITHWDQQKQEEQEKNKMQIKNRLEKEFNVHSVIFVSKSTSGIELCSQIDQIIEAHQSELIKITDSQFFTFWKLLDTDMDQDDIFFEMAEMMNECISAFRKKSQILTKFISTARQDVLCELTVVLKAFVNQHIEEFIEKNFNFYSELEQRIGDAAFLSYYQLKREMISDLNHLTRTIQEKMFSFPEHCFNFIKRCPFCNEIWMKVTNCNEKITVCGYIPGLDEQENLQQQIEKYNFYFQGNELKYQKVPIQEQKIINKSIKQQQQSCLSKIGCRRQFNWNEAAPLTPGQKRELLDTEVFDFLAMEVTQINQKQQQKYLKSIEEEMKRVVIKQL